MSFPRYPKYKDSGVEWLGEVPAHWEVKRLKRAAHVFPSNVDKKSYEGETPVLLCNYTDVYYNETITPAIDFMPATASADQIAKFTLRAGDTIITKDSETADDIAIAAYVPEDLPGVVCGYHLAVVRPEDGYAGAFIKRLFDSNYAKSCFAVLANGLTRMGLGQHELDNVEFPFPPRDEQCLIARFLEREVAKIDALVTEQQRLIELLEEKRQAVISHAVTQGLNPDVPMKPSGVEWLGDVPERWEMKRLRVLFRQEKRQNQEGKEVLSVYRDYGVIRKSSRDDNFNKTPENLDAYQLVNRGDLVINKMKAWQGSLGVSEFEGITSPDYMVFSPRHQESSAFLHFHLRSQRIVSVYRSISNGIRPSQWRLEPESFLSLPIFLPPIPEQEALVSFVAEQIMKVDALSAEAERAIALLQERRTALISAAVTGKIDVRGLARVHAA
ncbi:MAG: restriction endonuclease subunit S [Gemmatimonadaceae bacterium]